MARTPSTAAAAFFIQHCYHPATFYSDNTLQAIGNIQPLVKELTNALKA
jgi:hypothetical protein